ncbi:hypothetical protein [Branchiibius hedensis]|uniref:hypothetical protein n=1 Tax=Branchiibius hedensis TaxID=672460 RepID=UPI000D6C11CE|nr:hypothetical protein [Branchiibius hedensis]
MRLSGTLQVHHPPALLRFGAPITGPQSGHAPSAVGIGSFSILRRTAIAEGRQRRSVIDATVRTLGVWSEQAPPRPLGKAAAAAATARCG